MTTCLMREGDEFAGTQKASDDPMMRIKIDPELIPSTQVGLHRLQDGFVVKVVARDEGLQKIADVIEITALSWIASL